MTRRAHLLGLALALAATIAGCPAHDAAPPGRTPGRASAPAAEEGPPAEDVGLPRTPLVRIPTGRWTPLFLEPSRAPDAATDAASAAPLGTATPVVVPAFDLEVVPVTNADFLRFVRGNPEWRRSRVSRVRADAGYLTGWAGDTDLGAASPRAPVTRVSWFAARAYARWVGRRLPTVAEWERAATVDEDGARDPELAARAERWCTTPGVLAEVGLAPPDRHGVRDLHGLWEWTEDWNASLLSGEQRGGPDAGRFCGAGSLGSSRPGDFPAFMREALRGSLGAADTLASLGFRCAADARDGDGGAP